MQPTNTPEHLIQQGFSKTFVKRFWKKVNKDGPIPTHMPHLGQCWIWTAYKQEGYGKFWARNDTKTMMLAHVASWILHGGEPRENLSVCHHCDNPECVRFSHLFLGTKQDNSDDAKRKGRTALYAKKGEANGTHKLTSKQVLEIRKIYSEGGISMLNLGKMFSVSERNVFFIVHRLHWKHI